MCLLDTGILTIHIKGDTRLSPRAFEILPDLASVLESLAAVISLRL